MNNRSKVFEIAEAYLLEAVNDYDAVPILIAHEKYNLAVYHAQQAVEKLFKACLAAEGAIGIYKHEVFRHFKEVFSTKIDAQTMNSIEENVIELEEEWALSRYPDWEVEPIWIPSRGYTKQNAEERRNNMNIVFEILTKFLRDNYKLKKKKE
ncbi:MAG: HEPN domain-containing protein [archaeon]|nr:HEPN domain-containing protein [archaeon]